MNHSYNQGIVINSNQSMVAMGPAVGGSNWNSSAAQVMGPVVYRAANDGGLGPQGTILYSNIQYYHNPNDGVGQLAAPTRPLDPLRGVYNILFNLDQHSMESYRHHIK